MGQNMEDCDFPVMGLVDGFNVNNPFPEYEAANFNNSVMINFEPTHYYDQYLPTLEICETNSFSYHLTPPTLNNGQIVDSLSNTANAIGGFNHHCSIYAVDEPGRERMDDIHDLIVEIRNNFFLHKLLRR